MIAQGRRGDLDVDVDDPVLEQSIKAARDASRSEVGGSGEIDETGAAVRGERTEHRLVLGSEAQGLASDDR
ncbi:hypothetical protein SVIO_008990 [Streptomyces violaceusniger]|uniref:Uncharacterized protein n=1 Tax=Streptomyces violaceusniger TaxID=68280 RepID=A0A4D4KTQ4_STRVO|nr:hypothetical protein SVIO_008990 [Streptomyces violaceusniger]